MTPADLVDAIVVAVGGVVADACLDVPVQVQMPAAVAVERVEGPGRGDYATAVALQLARAVGRPSRELAEALAVRLRGDAGVAAVDVAGPGFLDIHVTAAALGEIARTAVRAGDGYGCAGASRGVRVHVEVAPTDPAGPVTVEYARRSAVGEALARLLSAAGFEVGAVGRAGGARGKVAVPCGGVIPGAAPCAYLPSPPPFVAAPAAHVVAGLAEPDADADVDVDADGEVAAEAASAGVSTTVVEVAGGQSVTLTRSGEPVGEAVGVPGRAGAVPLLSDVVDVVGADAARYALLRVSLDAPLVLDLELLARRVSENPVFRVQYAHARSGSLARNAAEVGVVLDLDGADVALLTDPRERALLRAVGELPRVVAAAAEQRAPHRLARYLEELAGTCLRCYETCRVLPLGEQEPTAVHGARLLLVEATGLALANGLRLLDVDAPERI